MAAARRAVFRPLRILLVKPRPRLGTIRALERFTRLEPLELGMLAGAVDTRHAVRILDLRLGPWPERALSRAVARFAPDVVGLSAYSHEASLARELAARVRAIAPRSFVVVGGHHATVAAVDLNVPQIDAIVRGEGCGPFAALVDALAHGDDPVGLPGVLRTGPDFDPAAARVWPVFPDPATLPGPRRDLYDTGRYFSVWLAERIGDWHRLFPPTAMVRSSYGCTQRCSFCVVPFLCGGEHRVRPVEAIAGEIAALPQAHVYFADDENFLNERFAADLAEALERRGVRKRYYAWTRATTVLRSPELLRRWAELGLDAAFLGFEFPSDAELRASRKGSTVAANERALDLLRGLGVAVHAAFLITPDYDEGDFERLRRYVAALPPAEHSFTVCTPSPGTPDYETLRPRIWVSNPHDLHDAMHPLTPTALPLRRFAARYAALVAEGLRRSPLHAVRRPVRPWELARALAAERAWRDAFVDLYRDYPRELWDREGAPAA